MKPERMKAMNRENGLMSRMPAFVRGTISVHQAVSFRAVTINKKQHKDVEKRRLNCSLENEVASLVQTEIQIEFCASHYQTAVGQLPPGDFSNKQPIYTKL